ncbi:hypothetical protein COV61_02810 [Candidatus Micrarchaeota archaeon CG11_big_fil_rev_8_21_14_0_20_47_5]|nr:MAG: hypothetical protein AUJ17_05340 [Candidatus Micrarchaeota archaeon CG1_02_47_40]PIN83537.1 MAG: hypothetical protein COV61_02810 [Candidatus Micrarchaeota archaeon CG11_big_fil_rev_8_21_14_0_20_47_5]
MEYISLKDIPEVMKQKLLERLGYGSKDGYVVDNSGKRVQDKYVGIDVSLSNMLIFPGSTVILDNNPLSIAAYLDEYDKEI